MLRNQSREKTHKFILISPQPSNYNQSSHLILKPQQPSEFVPLEKARTFSHKKLSLTSTLNSPQANDTIRKVIMPTFQVNKFYRPATKGNLLMQSKKISIEESKISLKLSSASKIDIGTPEKNQENCYGLNARNSIGSSVVENQRMKSQIHEFVNSRLHFLNNQINSQSMTINSLKQRIQALQLDIRAKNQVINSLLNEKLQHQQNQNYNKYPHLEARLSDLEKVLSITGTQSNKAQNSLNSKLDSLTRQLVQMNISNQSKETARMKNILLGLSSKLEIWLKDRQNKMENIEKQCNRIQEKSSTIQEIKGNLRLIGYKVDKIQQGQLRKKELNLRMSGVKNNSQLWDTFQDYVVTNRSDYQLKNKSTVSQDDYFFHPQHLTQQTPRLKQSISSGLSTSSACSNPFSRYHPTQTPIKTNTSSPFNQLISIMQQLKQQQIPLPIKCQVDKHNRILTKHNNKLLQNQETKSYYKIGNQQLQILINRGYLILEN